MIFDYSYSVEGEALISLSHNKGPPLTHCRGYAGVGASSFNGHAAQGPGERVQTRCTGIIFSAGHKEQESCYNGFMLKIVLREILIFLMCAAILPAVVFVLLLQTESAERVIQLLIRVVAGPGLSPLFDPFAILMKIMAPYAVVQAIRAHFWSQRSLTGRRWANLYFVVILLVGAGWAFVDAWDLLYLIYAVGDLPEGLPAFIELEFTNVSVFVVCIALAVYCAIQVASPARHPTPKT